MSDQSRRTSSSRRKDTTSDGSSTKSVPEEAAAKAPPSPFGLPPIFIQVLAWTILAAWVASLLADVLIKEYEPNPTIHICMMAIVGSVFTAGILRKEN